eukprot:4297029-Amphidinium_carterae.1
MKVVALAVGMAILSGSFRRQSAGKTHVLLPHSLSVKMLDGAGCSKFAHESMIESSGCFLDLVLSLPQ